MPLRRCVGCGRVAPKAQLVRLALQPGPHGARPRVAIDRAGTMPGRGAYLCRDPSGARIRGECLSEAVRRRAFARALRHAVDVPSELVESVGR